MRTYDLPETIVRGTSGSASWELFDDAGNPIVDFTGWSVTATVSLYTGAPTALHTFSLTDGNARLENGRVYLDWSAAESDGFDWRLAPCQILVSDGTNASVPIKVWLRVTPRAVEEVTV